MRLTIRSKLTVLVLAVLLPLLVVAASKFWRDLGTGRRVAQQEQLDTARLVARQLDEVISGQVETLHAVASLHSLERVQDTDLAALANRVGEQHPFMRDFLVVDAAGRVIASSSSSGGAAAGLAISREAVETALRIGVPFVGPAEQWSAGEWAAVPLLIPIRDRAGTIVGVAAAVIDLGKLSLYLDALPLGPDQTLALATPGGALLARTADPGKILRRDLGSIPEAVDLLRHGGGIAEWRPRDGTPLLAGAVSMLRAPWIVVVGVPTESAYGPAAARFKNDLLGLATAMVLALLLAWLVGNRMNSSVQALMRGTRELEQAQGAPITVPTKDELAELADQFNRAITDRRRTQADLDARQRRLKALADITVALSQQLDLEPLLKQITLALSSLTGARTVVFWEADAPRDRLVRRAWSADAGVASVDLPGALGFDEGATGWIARHRKALFIEDITRDARVMSQDWAMRYGLRVFAGVPVVSGDELLGVLTLNLETRNLRREDDEALLVSFASQAAVAVRNARLFAETEGRRREAEELARLARALTESLDITAVAERTVESVNMLFAARSAVIRLRRPDGSLVVLASSGSARDQLPPGHVLPAGAGISGRAVAEEGAVWSADVNAAPGVVLTEDLRERNQLSDLGAVLAVPLRTTAEIIGMLAVADQTGREFTRAEGDLLQTFADQAALALENARHYAEARRRQSEAEELARVARMLTETLDVNAVADRMAHSVLPLFGVDSAGVRLLRDDGALMAVAWAGAAAEYFKPGHVLTPGAGLGARAVSEGRAVRSRDLFDDAALHLPEDLRTRLEASGTRAFMAAPLRAKGRLIGVLAVGAATPRDFSDAEATLLQTFADQAALAIENARLYGEATRRQHEAEELARVARALTGSLDVHEVGQRIVDSVRPLFHARSSGFRLVQPDGSLVMLAQGQADGVHSPHGHVVPAGFGVVGRVVTDGHAYVTADIGADTTIRLTDETRRRVHETGIGAFAAVPLRVRGHAIGALSIADATGRVFTEVEVTLLQTFADQAALALDHARLYEQTRDRLRHVESIREIIEQVLVPFSLEERLNLVARKAAELFDADMALVGLRPEGLDHLVIRAGYQLVEGELGQRIEIGEGALGLAAERREGVLVNDYATWQGRLRRRLSIAHRESLRATISYPLLIRGEVIGALSVAFVSGNRRFVPEDVDRLATLAAPAALAIEHSRLYDQLASRLQELQATQAQLVQAGKLSAVGQLVSGVAHELNNPLSVVIGYGQLLRSKPLAAEIRSPIEMIVSQGERMAKIVQSLLLFSRQRKPERAPVQVAGVIEQAIALRATRMRLSGIKVELDHDPDVPPAEGDAHQLQQVFLNLLLNAEHAILGSGIGDTVHVRAGSRAEGGKLWVVVEFADNGPGITAEVLPRIFEPFFTTKKVGQGTGLGLSVSYGIVQQHGGRLTAKSAPGRTVFTVELPAAMGAEPAPHSADAVPAGVYGFGRRALVVDDEPGMVELVTALLKETGWQVEVAATGRAALERVRAGRYDVIISDIRMPDGSGEDFYRVAVKDDPALARRFVFMTGDTANPAAWQFLEESQVPILEKPFTADTLFRALERMTILTSRAACE